jgi:gamma-glutamyltranspeptidase / glutathione hydrolase
MQPQGHAQLLINLLDYGMDPQQAVEHPRHRHEDGVLLIEDRIPEDEIARLRGRGHRIDVREDFMIPAGGAQLIRIMDNGVRACGSDPRKDGCALAQ